MNMTTTQITRTTFVNCPTCDWWYDRNTGVSVEWDVMGDPNSSIVVCASCAEQSVNAGEGA